MPGSGGTDHDAAVRAAVQRWLEDETDGGRRFHLFTAEELRRGVVVAGERVPLVAPQQGIWKPRGLRAALSIRTTFTPPGQPPPYDDAVGADGLLRYKYRGDDPDHADNRALRAALEEALPLVWFWGVARAVYEAVWPVWLVGEERSERQFAVAVHPEQRRLPAAGGEPERRYAERLTRERVHQPLFRARVIEAYRRRCAMCGLGYASLLDAAHILPDGHPRGDPVVPNGLSLCKIHHAAFDQDLLGVRPDRLVVEVRADVLRARDGPMLVHGLQAMHGRPLLVPASPAARPDRSRLEERWEAFRRAV
jgi:putative restriction endonuclease